MFTIEIDKSQLPQINKQVKDSNQLLSLGNFIFTSNKGGDSWQVKVCKVTSQFLELLGLLSENGIAYRMRF